MGTWDLLAIPVIQSKRKEKKGPDPLWYWRSAGNNSNEHEKIGSLMWHLLEANRLDLGV